MPCGCGGSQEPRQTTRQQQPVRQVRAAVVPGGPGEDGYTWNGPRKPQKAEPRKRTPAAGSK